MNTTKTILYLAITAWFWPVLLICALILVGYIKLAKWAGDENVMPFNLR